MVGELVIAQSMVSQDGLVINSANHSLAKKVSHTLRETRRGGYIHRVPAG
jgi:hypothetical protein